MASKRASSRASESGRVAARAAATAFGGQPQVRRYYDEDESHSVDILRCDDRPAPGLVSYSTLTLHTSPNMLEDADVRVEIAGVAPITATQFPNLLATAAFFVIKDRWLCAPGVVFTSLITHYEPKLSSTLAHVMWTFPFPWDRLATVQLADDLLVHWLLAVPISEQERQFLLERGFEVVEALFVERKVDYFNLGRRSEV